MLNIYNKCKYLLLQGLKSERREILSIVKFNIMLFQYLLQLRQQNHRNIISEGYSLLRAFISTAQILTTIFLKLGF